MPSEMPTQDLGAKKVLTEFEDTVDFGPSTKKLKTISPDTPLDESFYNQLEGELDAQQDQGYLSREHLPAFEADVEDWGHELNDVGVSAAFEDTMEPLEFEDTGVFEELEGLADTGVIPVERITTDESFEDTGVAGPSTIELSEEFLTDMYEIIDQLPDARYEGGQLLIEGDTYDSQGVAGKGGMAEASLFSSHDSGENLILKTIDLVKDNGFGLGDSLAELQLMDALHRANIKNIPKLVTILNKDALRSQENIPTLSIVMSYEGKTINDIGKDSLNRLAFDVLDRYRTSDSLDQLASLVNGRGEVVRNLVHDLSETSQRIKIEPESEQELLSAFKDRWKESISLIGKADMLSTLFRNLDRKDAIELDESIQQSEAFREKMGALQQVSETVQMMHDAGYIHGDISLKNITLKQEEDGKVTGSLIDFGLTTNLEIYQSMGETKREQILAISDAIVQEQRGERADQFWSNEVLSPKGSPRYMDSLLLMGQSTLEGYVDGRIKSTKIDVPGYARVMMDAFTDSFGIEQIPSLFELVVADSDGNELPSSMANQEGVRVLPKFTEEHYGFMMMMLRSVTNEDGKQLIPEAYFKANFIGYSPKDGAKNPLHLFRQDQIQLVRPEVSDLANEMAEHFNSLSGSDIEIIRAAMIDLGNEKQMASWFTQYKKMSDWTSLSTAEKDDLRWLKNMKDDIGDPFPYSDMISIESAN